MRLEYEPASEPLHISVKHLSSNWVWCEQISLMRGNAAYYAPHCVPHIFTARTHEPIKLEKQRSRCNQLPICAIKSNLAALKPLF